MNSSMESKKNIYQYRLPHFIKDGSKLTRLWHKHFHYFFLIIPAVFYFITACKTPGWVDATLIVSNVVNLTLGSWVNYHNLFHILGYGWLWMFPSTNIHYYLVLLSALFGTLTVYIMFRVGMELTSSKLVSAIGALILMFSHSLWWHSTMLEVYTLNAAIIAAILLFIVRYNKNKKIINLYFAAFFFGLGCSNHLLMGLFIFAFLFLIGAIIYKRKTLTLKKMLILTFCFLLGFQLYLYVFILDYRRNVRWLQSGESTSEVRLQALKITIHYATGGGFKKYMFPKDISPDEKRFWRLNYLILILLNYPSGAFFLCLFGFYCFWKKKGYRLTFIFILFSLIAQIIWSGNYFIWDMYAFALPVYVILSIPIIMSIDFLFHKGKAARIILLCLLPTFIVPPFIYSRVAEGGRKQGIVKSYFKNYPEWDWALNTWEVVEYIVNPNKRDYTKVPEYAEKIFEILPQGAHFWNSVGRADYPLRLYYQDIYKIRTDINHHSLFSPLMTPEQAKTEAVNMKMYIQSGMPVYIASHSYPERAVLDELYVLLDPAKSLNQVSSLSIEELINSFPDIKIEKITLFEQEQIWIYQILKKNEIQ